MPYQLTKLDPLHGKMLDLSDEEMEHLVHALDDAAQYRIGDEAANVEEIEEEDDKDRYMAYVKLEDRLIQLKEA